MARPTLLTPELQDALVRLIGAGVRHKDAAEAMGLSYATFKEWLARGEGTDPDRPTEPIYVEFAMRVRESSAQVKAALQAGAIKACRSADDFLKVLKAFYPDEWTDRMEVTINIRREAEKLAAETGLNVDDIMVEVESYLAATR